MKHSGTLFSDPLLQTNCDGSHSVRSFISILHHKRVSILTVGESISSEHLSDVPSIGRSNRRIDGRRLGTVFHLPLSLPDGSLAPHVPCGAGRIAPHHGVITLSAQPHPWCRGWVRTPNCWNITHNQDLVIIIIIIIINSAICALKSGFRSVFYFKFHVFR